MLCAAAAGRARRGKIKLVWALAAILLGCAALGICLLPQRSAAAEEPEQPGAAPDGAPQAAVTEFFDALCAQDYKAAYRKLSGVSTLGLENTPEAADAAAIWRALEQSWDYRLYGECASAQGGAVQQLVFTTLDLDALGAAVKAETETKVERLAAELPQSEIYNDEGSYLESFTERAYTEALEEVLARAADYETVVGLNVRLVRSGSDWLIEPDGPLYAALTGGMVK